jgi:hypothetical protein
VNEMSTVFISGLFDPRDYTLVAFGGRDSRSLCRCWRHATDATESQSIGAPARSIRADTAGSSGKSGFVVLGS